VVGFTTHRPAQAVPGDEKFVTLLVQEHGASLIAYATHLTGDRHAAEDIVQETLTRAWQRSDTLTNGKGSVRGWLLTVVRNIVIDQARARAARPREVAAAPSDPATSDDHADDVATSITLLALLDTLGEDHRQVLIELYYRGKSVAEAAEALDVPVGTVKSRAFYALRLLRQRLQEPRPEAGPA